MRGVRQAELLAERYHGERPPNGRVRHRVTEAIQLSDKRLKVLAACLRESPGPSPCGCTLGRQATMAREESELRGVLIEQWRHDPTAKATITQIRRWSEVSAARWETLARWFDDEAFGHGSLATRHQRFRAELTTPWWTEAASRA